MLIELLLFVAMAFGTVGGPANLNQKPSSKEGVQLPLTDVEQPADPKLSLKEMVFENHQEFNLSLGVQKLGKEYFLIVEMDHNPAKHGFVLDFAEIGSQVEMINTVRDNHFFGVNNKATTFLPMLETVFQKGSKNVQYIPQFQGEFRTYQRVNITEVLKRLAIQGNLYDSEKNQYKASDIEAIRLIITESPSDILETVIKPIRIDLFRLADGETKQVYGERLLSDLAEIQKYKLGDRVTLMEDHKVPAAKRGYQWVQISTNTEKTYKLIKEIKVGDILEVETTKAESFLPRIQKGQRWVSLESRNGKTKFQLMELPMRTSEALIQRYIDSISTHMNNDWGESEREQRLSELLAKSPIEIQESRLTAVAEEIVKDRGVHIAEILLREQNHSRKPHLPVILRCQSILNVN